MGLFGKLFDKKICDVCGGEIGLLGNRKLEDGNLCKECAKKLSPFFSDRKNSTVAEIKEQLAYREANQADVAAFQPTRTLGGSTKVLLDEDKGCFVVTSARNWRDTNPDVIQFSQVTGCDYTVKETKTELKREDKDGNKVSYNPPRYDIDYDFYVSIYVNSPWFSEINFKLNPSRIERRGDAQYRDAERQAQELKETLTKVRENIRETVAAASAPKAAMTCPWCGATTTPDASGCCEYCGGSLNG